MKFAPFSENSSASAAPRASTFSGENDAADERSDGQHVEVPESECH